MARAFPTAVIENLRPLINGGRYSAKRIAGDDLAVEADVFKDGHDVVAAALKWRLVGEPRWHETAMSFVDNDRWRGICSLNAVGVYEYTVEAWTDTFRSWRDEFTKKFEAGISDLTAEALEGAVLINSAGKRAHVAEDSTRLCELSECVLSADNAQINNIVHSGELEVLMATYPDRSWATQYVPPPRVIVEREAAEIAAWYEFFPRSAEGRGDRGSTFRDCLPRVDDARAMGFNVIYFPPIHPIGHTNRKGRNNAVTAEPGDPGVPWAIGSEAGGHKAVEPALGSLEDFDWLQGEVRKRGMEIALDFAINCSPDHPYVREKYPDTIFLAEAFTRPKMMKELAKAGFGQSYTYFTWRNTKQELTEYLTELTQTDMPEYFRGNLWPNTPDILPFFLQDGGRPAFIIRAVLAATLLPLYGIYSGYELCENEALPGREEYLDSEKYQFKERDWEAPGNIKDWITRLNQIRRTNRALRFYDNLRFYHADNDSVLFYGKMTAARDNIILIVVNLDPHRKQHSFIDVPVDQFASIEGDTYQVHDLLTGERYIWHGRRNYVELDPEIQPAHIFRVRRWIEGDRFA